MSEYKLVCIRREKGVELSKHVVDCGSQIQCQNARTVRVNELETSAHLLGLPMFVTNVAEVLSNTQYVYFNHQWPNEIELQFSVMPL